jgi:hypothetical protein
MRAAVSLVSFALEKSHWCQQLETQRGQLLLDPGLVKSKIRVLIAVASALCPVVACGSSLANAHALHGQ